MSTRAVIAVGFVMTFWSIAAVLLAIQVWRTRRDLDQQAFDAHRRAGEALARRAHPSTQSRHLHQVHPMSPNLRLVRGGDQ